MIQTKDSYNTAHSNITRFGRTASYDLSLPTEDNQELFRVRASMWTELFPDELVINEKTVSLIQRSLLGSSIATILVKDIGRVVYADTIIFAGLEVLGKNTAHDLYVKGLYKRDAIIAKEMIEKLLLNAQESQEPPLWPQMDTKKRI